MATETEPGTPKKASRGMSATLTRLIQRVNTVRVLKVYAILITIFLYLPIITLIVFSFNAGGLTFPFVGFTTEWYGVLFANEKLATAFITSLKLSFVTMLIATPLSTMVGLAYRRRFKGRRLVLNLLLVAIILPGITYGLGTTLFLNELLGLPKSWWLAITVEVVWTVPFGVIVIIVGFPPNLVENERAARMMGASRLTVFRDITLPQIWPTMLGAAIFSFTLTYNEATRSLLIIGTETPIANQVFAIATRQEPTPELYALGSVTTVVSVILLLAALTIVLLYGAGGTDSPE